jgi:AraC-like DNA-binding protein
MTPTVFAPALGIVFKCLESQAMDPDPLCRELQIDPEVMNNPDKRVPYRTMDLLRAKAVEMSGDPCFGLKIGCGWHPSYHGALGYAWLASATLRNALERLSRYLQVISDAGGLDLKEIADGLSMTFNLKETTVDSAALEDMVLAQFITMCRLNCGEELNPVSVSFTHSMPACAGSHYALFRCPIEFQAADLRVTLPLDAVDKRLTTSNPALVQLSEQFMIEYLARRESASITQRVQNAIMKRLPSGDATDAAISEDLYTSTRTLQRRLKDEGTTFKSILGEVRRELAEKYIYDDSLSLSEISFLLGFSNISSFSRAFKRWTGFAPSTYRQVN